MDVATPLTGDLDFLNLYKHVGACEHERAQVHKDSPSSMACKGDSIVGMCEWNRCSLCSVSTWSETRAYLRALGVHRSFAASRGRFVQRFLLPGKKERYEVGCPV